MRSRLAPLLLLLATGSLIGPSKAASSSVDATLVIPQPEQGGKRPITKSDLIKLRDIGTLSVSPDGASYVILVRQADADSNSYRSAWFLGPSDRGALTYLGDGGEAYLRQYPSGHTVGILAADSVRWSPDGGAVAYTAMRDGQLQLWSNTVRRGGQRQLTHNDADIRDFAWSAEGKRLYFTVGESRGVSKAHDEHGRRDGFLLEDFQFYSEIIHMARPIRPLSKALTTWVVGADGKNEHRASDAERAEFDRLKSHAWGRGRTQGVTIQDLSGANAPPVISSAGHPAWLARESEAETGPMPLLRVTASLNADGSNPIRCTHEACTSQMFSKLWWSADGKHVIFWRKQDANFTENGFFAWSPADGTLRELYHQDGDEFAECDFVNRKLFCARQTVSRPDHVVSIDTETAAVTVLADVNPEFQNLQLGRVERFTYAAAPDTYRLGYPQNMFGYIIFPSDFDPRRRYPVFVAPYGAPGFRRGDVGDEHPLFVYAANGFVVISSQFPAPVAGYRRGTGPSAAELYSLEHGFPHLSMLANSTWSALDAVAARGFVDSKRIGIGGLSHGAFIPLFMLQHSDRLSAVSIASPGASQTEYYISTRTGRALQPQPWEWPEDRAFWTKIDIADHVEKVEAPLLVNYADREFFNDWRLPRSMENGRRAYEAHIFPNEHHIKWQPVHRLAIYNRNLDWFRFWLQDVEDPDPAKAAQYERWRKLRDLQCRNTRSLRSYCQLTSSHAAPAR